MPQLKDIEQFKNSLRLLGNEPEILSQWGETYVDEPIPEQKVPDDLAGLLDDSSSAMDSSEEAAPSVNQSPEDLEPDQILDSSTEDDFTSFLNDMNLDESSSEPEASLEPETFDMPSEALDDFSSPGDLLSGLQDDLAETPQEPDMFEAESASEPEESAPEDFASDEPASAESLPEDFNMPDFSDLEPLEETESSEGDSASEAVEPSAPEDFGFGDLSTLGEESPESAKPAEDDFGFGSMEEFSEPKAIPEISEETEPSENKESAEIEDLEDFGDLGDLGGEESPPAEPSSIDAFDSFDFTGGGNSLPDLGNEDFGSSSISSDLDSQIASLDNQLPEAENFSLENAWGNDFNIPGYELKTAKKEPEKTSKPNIFDESNRANQKEAAERPAEDRPVDLSDTQVDLMQDSLLSYPLNLRLAVEDIIANEKGTTAQQSSLIWMLVEGSPIREVSKLAGKILKKYIEIPSGYEKRTGAALEAEKSSFAYIFKHNIWPALQVILLVAAGLALVFFISYNFIYRPIHANSLYAEGYRQLQADKFPESGEFFAKADRTWIQKKWYYKYAQGYVDKKQFPLARHMYELLLWRWPLETKAALSYARMELGQTAFPEAEKVLKRYILERDYFNQQALLLMADVYLAWAEYEEQKLDGAPPELLADLYEKARLQLATIMENHGRTDSYLERMLLYFIRVEHSTGVDKLREISPIADYFLKNEDSKFSCRTVAELGEYLMDRGTTDNVQSILARATHDSPLVPEGHATIARWFRMAKIADKERKALENADAMFVRADEASPLDTKRVRAYLNVLIRRSEILMQSDESLDAEPLLTRCIQRYERSLEEKKFRRTAEFGKAYALLADIYFFKHRDFKGALARYQTAEAHRYYTPDTDYRSGYIYYIAFEDAGDGARGDGARGDDPQDSGARALDMFYRAGLDREQSPYLLYATANTLYRRSDWFAAQGYYTMLAQRLQFELDTIALPEPQTRPSHAELVELIMKTKNNLGATLVRIGERLGDGRKRAGAMLAFTESARLFDSLVRDQKTMLRPETKNLGFLNMDFILHPKRGVDIGIYADIMPDMKFPRD